MSSLTRSYLAQLPVQQRLPDCVTKTANARDLILTLPSPASTQRIPELIPDITVKLILPIGNTLPAIVREKIPSKEAAIANDDTVFGMALNGRQTHPVIFLNTTLMEKRDPNGALLEEITWHETLHALEEIGLDHQGQQKRPEPWSFNLQNKMLHLDEVSGSGMPLDILQEPSQRTLLQYLRLGTSAQENVSEIFARVGVLFLQEIRSKGTAPVPEDILTPATLHAAFNNRAADYNLRELSCALITYGEDATELFWQEFPNMVGRISKLYGLEY